jgi:hypothetical protein
VTALYIYEMCYIKKRHVFKKEFRYIWVQYKTKMRFPCSKL